MGAVAYFSQSKYGKHGNSNYIGTNKEVLINNCSNFITGIGGDTVSANGSSITCTTNTYETQQGQGASTTGNITGIYDMAGASYEYTMGVLADSSGTPRSGYVTQNNSGFNGTLSDETTYTNGIDLPETKYYDLYTAKTLNAGCDGGVCFGHALSETSNWYSDYAYSLREMYPWMTRDGYYDDGVGAGVFSSGSSSGDARGGYSMRVVIAP